MPLVSVITPVHNSERFIGETIESILSQTFTDFEYIIVNDHSIDKTSEIIQSFKDERIKMIDNDGSGSVSSYNKALEISSGKYIAVIDHDDIAGRERLKSQVEVLEKDKADVTGSFYNIIDENGKLISRQTLPVKDADIKEMMLYRNAVLHTGCMYRKELINKYGYYREDRFPSHDYDFWVRIMGEARFYNIPDFLQSWRVVQTSPSQSDFQRQQDKSLEILSEYFEMKFKNENEQWKKYFMMGRAKYYFDSPSSAARYFGKSLAGGNYGSDNLVFLLKSSLLSPLVSIYRKRIGRKRFGKK